MSEQREAYERRKTAMSPKKRQWWPAKDLISMSLAVMAFVISSLTTYVNVIRQLDEAKAVFHQFPTVDIVQTDFLIGQHPVSFAVINSGSRSLATFAVIIGINPNIEANEENACDGSIVWFQTTFAAVALKPGEISLQEVRLKKYKDDTITKPGPDGGWLIARSALKREQGRVSYGVCAAFETSSPAIAQKITHVDVGHFVRYTDGSLKHASGPKTPITLISERTTLFAR